MKQTEQQVFQAIIWDYYEQHGRHDLPWRSPEPNDSFDPYKILVSELMLQQTQVGRVIPKYHEFLQIFPTVDSLARAPLAMVLKAWSGLGYNRRAKFLWQAAQQLRQQYDGIFPDSVDELVQLPGVGKNTAGAIIAYAFNRPVVFVETNIRTVYIHHFFHDEVKVSDSNILELLQATLDRQQPRIWYWALMDYGSYLKKTVGNLSRQSQTYAKQAPFHGSKRQIRGQVLRILATGSQPYTVLQQQVTDDRLSLVLTDLVSEQLIHQKDDVYFL